MSRSEWKRENDRAFSRSTDDGWVADVWKQQRTLSWRHSITTPAGTTTIGVLRAKTHSAAKAHAWAWLQRERAAWMNRRAA